MKLLLILSSLASLFQSAYAADDQGKQFRILHRLYSPTRPGADNVLFTPRATIILGENQNGLSSLVPASSSDLYRFMKSSDAANALTDRAALYQVAIERVPAAVPNPAQASDAEGQVLDISSVKACHLPLATSDHLTLHLTSTGVPYSLDYFLSPLPPSAACPSKKALAQRSESAPLDLFQSSANTTLSIKKARVPPLPELRTPPPLSPQGAPITPPPEKSFIQKYWIYIAVALVALLLSPGGPDEERSGGGGAGGGR